MKNWFLLKQDNQLQEKFNKEIFNEGVFSFINAWWLCEFSIERVKDLNNFINESINTNKQKTDLSNVVLYGIEYITIKQSQGINNSSYCLTTYWKINFDGIIWKINIKNHITDFKINQTVFILEKNNNYYKITYPISKKDEDSMDWLKRNLWFIVPVWWNHAYTNYGVMNIKDFLSKAWIKNNNTPIIINNYWSKEQVISIVIKKKISEEDIYSTKINVVKDMFSQEIEKTIDIIKNKKLNKNTLEIYIKQLERYKDRVVNKQIKYDYGSNAKVVLLDTIDQLKFILDRSFIYHQKDKHYQNIKDIEDPEIINQLITILIKWYVDYWF